MTMSHSFILFTAETMFAQIQSFIESHGQASTAVGVAKEGDQVLSPPKPVPFIQEVSEMPRSLNDRIPYTGLRHLPPEPEMILIEPPTTERVEQSAIKDIPPTNQTSP
jgi:hypothetical protein